MTRNQMIMMVGILLLLSACAASGQEGEALAPAATVTETLPTSTPADPVPLTFDGVVAYDHVIAQVDMGPRIVGSEGSQLAQAYIIAHLQEAGWTVVRQEFTVNGVTGVNLIAHLPGMEGLPSATYGAHYDTRIYADNDPLYPQQPVPGANDGASGTAVLLELARVMEPAALQIQPWLVFFDAEDNGRIDDWDWIEGSTYFVQSLDETQYPEYAVIVDMIGDADQQVFYETTSNRGMMEHLWEIAASLGYSDTIIPQDKYAILDDHTPFLRVGIPAVDMIDFDYEYWHTVDDTIDKVSPDSLERIGRTLEVFLEEQGGIFPPG